MYLLVAWIAECLEVGPLKAEVAALLLGTATLHLHYVMNTAGGHHVTLGLTALTKGIGSELSISELTPLTAVHELDV